MKNNKSKLKKRHGGARSGAGAPRLENDVQKRRNISLSEFFYKTAKDLGDGNASEGIRRALAEVSS